MHLGVQLNILMGNKFINFVAILLVLVLAWLVGKAFWTLYDDAQIELVVPATQAKTVKSQVSEVASPVYLFGRAERVQQEQAPVDNQNVKKTRLKLKLLGVLISPEYSIAIIENNSKSFSYSLDETIQDGVLLKEVYPDYVVLSHNGLLEKLQMVKDDEIFVQNADSPELNQRQKTILKNVKENALKNPISIMRYVRFEMVQKSGKVQAVKVWPQREKEIFTSLGFQAGDELKVVNGHAVADLMKSPAIWQELLKQSSLDLTVDRNGQTQNILVQLN